MRFKDIARNMASESAIGCVTHFLMAVAGFAFLRGAASHRGWSGRILFVLVALMLFAGAVFIPVKLRK